jgi:hypothetical protein
MHFGQCQELSKAVVKLAGEFAAFFVLKLQYADAQAAGAFLGAFTPREFVAEQAEVNPQKQNREAKT